MSLKTRNFEASINTLKTPADLQETGFHFMPEKRPHCGTCTSSRLCEQLSQVDKTIVNPGTPLCDTVRARGPKHSK